MKKQRKEWKGRRNKKNCKVKKIWKKLIEFNGNKGKKIKQEHMKEQKKEE